MPRPSWEAYFLSLIPIIGSRATCDRGKSGCVIVRDRRVITTGYVGSPTGLPHCDEAGHLLKIVTDADGVSREHCMRTLHAEQNAILQAAKNGVSLAGAELFCKMVPCRTCAMMIVSVGISKVTALKRYQADAESVAMFRTAGVELVVIDNTVETYGSNR